ncbi:MAG: hypothetical protein H0W88_05615 [Parachlamydiaceae bacterium]|nr:hypothetical protein [Parachlamydiaceae bacterium]
MPSINIINNSSSNNNFEVFQSPLTTQNIAVNHDISHAITGGDLTKETIKTMLDIIDKPGFHKTLLLLASADVDNTRSNIQNFESQLEELESNPNPDESELKEIHRVKEYLRTFRSELVDFNAHLDEVLKKDLPKIIESVNHLMVELKLPKGQQYPFDINDFNVHDLKEQLITGTSFFSLNMGFAIRSTVHLIINNQHERHDSVKVIQEKIAKLRVDKRNHPDQEKDINTEIHELMVGEAEIRDYYDTIILQNKIVLRDELRGMIQPHLFSLQQKTNKNNSLIDNGLFGLQQTTKSQTKVKSTTKKMKPKKNRGTKV